MEGKASGEQSMTEEVAVAIFESLGQPESTLAQRMAMAEKVISDQKVDLDKLKNRLHALTTGYVEKEETLQSLKEKTREVQMFLQQLTDWESALDQEEADLKKEIARFQAAHAQEDFTEDPPKHD